MNQGGTPMAHSRRRRSIAITVPAALLGAVAMAGSAIAVSGNQVIIGEDQDLPTLNSIAFGGNQASVNRITCPIQCENLLGLSNKFQYTAVLATRVPSGKDITVSPKFTVTFHIRPDAKWSDGQPVTSKDVKFTWQKQLDKKFKVASRSGWEEITDIKTPDAKTATLVFKRVFVPWRDIFNPSGGARLLPEHILKGKDLNTVWTNPDPKVFIGTGPFLLKQYIKGQRVILERNKNYWNKKAQPKIDTIVDQILKTTTSQAVQLKSKEVNFIESGAFGQALLDLKSIKNVKVDSVPSLTWEHLAFNFSDPVVGDVHVRRAISYALNPAEIIKTSTLGTTRPLFSFLIPEQAPFYKPSWNRYKPDPAKVDSELKAAGYAKNNGFYEKNGQPLTITFTTIAGNKTRETNFQLIKAQLEANGIKFGDPVFSPPDVLFGPTGPLNTGTYQVAEFAFQGSSDPSPTQLFGSAYIPTAASPSGQNVYHINDPNLDKLLAAQDKEISVAKRVVLEQKIQDLMADRDYVFPLYQRPQVDAYASNLNGAVNNPSQIGGTDGAQNWFYTGGKAIR